MRAPVHKPTVKELVDEIGGIPDDKHPGMIGLIFEKRILWVNVQSALLMDEVLSKALIKLYSREKGEPIKPFESMAPKTTPEPVKAPSLGFLPTEESLGDSGASTTEMKFDVGRSRGKPVLDEPEKKVLGEEESETLELPSWLDKDKLTGQATAHHADIEEGWIDVAPR